MISIIIQARMNSGRLPGKVLKTLAGHPMLWHIIERCKQAKRVDQIIVATTDKPEDDAIEQLCQGNNWLYFRGSEDNVLERFYLAAQQFHAIVIIRITADCPLVDPTIIDLCIDEFMKNSCDYISNVLPGPRRFSRGLDVEVFSFQALKKAYHEAMDPYDQEHVTDYIWGNKEIGKFRVSPVVEASVDYARPYRLTVDYPEDFSLIERIYEIFHKPGGIVDVLSVIRYLDDHSELLKINAHCVQLSERK